MMPKDMCLATGITYYEPAQILDWAEELREFAEHVIVIPKSPKYMSLIPDYFVLGLPSPTSYGAENEIHQPVPPEAYQGRKIHILGGSWARQLSYLYFYGDDIVSMDSNYIAKIAMLRQFIDPAGQVHDLKEVIHFELSQALHIAFSISCSSIHTALNKL